MTIQHHFPCDYRAISCIPAALVAGSARQPHHYCTWHQEGKANKREQDNKGFVVPRAVVGAKLNGVGVHCVGEVGIAAEAEAGIPVIGSSRGEDAAVGTTYKVEVEALSIVVADCEIARRKTLLGWTL